MEVCVGAVGSAAVPPSIERGGVCREVVLAARDAAQAKGKAATGLL